MLKYRHPHARDWFSPAHPSVSPLQHFQGTDATLYISLLHMQKKITLGVSLAPPSAPRVSPSEPSLGEQGVSWEQRMSKIIKVETQKM